MHEVLVNRLGGLSLPRKSVVRLTDRPDMTLDVYRGRQQQQYNNNIQSLVARTVYNGSTKNRYCYVCAPRWSSVSFSPVKESGKCKYKVQDFPF